MAIKKSSKTSPSVARESGTSSKPPKQRLARAYDRAHAAELVRQYRAGEQRPIPSPTAKSGVVNEVVTGETLARELEIFTRLGTWEGLPIAWAGFEGELEPEFVPIAKYADLIRREWNTLMVKEKIAECVREGMTVEKARGVVAERLGLTDDTVRNLLYRKVRRAKGVKLSDEVTRDISGKMKQTDTE